MANWKNYYEDLLTESGGWDDRVETPDENTERNIGITIKETNVALSKIKNGQFPCPGNVPVELLKAKKPMLVKRIAFLMNCCCQQIRTPTKWRSAHLVSFFKKGSRRDPNCYRGISILSTFARLYGKIIQEKVQKDLEQEIGEDQSGLRRANRAQTTCLYSNK
ncbi:uncharacterized protein LOC143908489 [Temnothorax americanus]|uniref:uncharacterized protein LOC143908489 n=1 Tax=Temnothorax americanus TaxID=1964332 RepID=UPI00406786C3